MEKKNSKIKPRIVEYAEYKGYSKRKIYTETGISNGVLDKKSGISEDGVDKILQTYPDINPLWLLTGKGEMLLKSNAVAEPNALYNNVEKKIEQQHIPLFDVQATCGVVEVISGNSKTIPLDLIQVPNAPKCDGAIYATGDSMYPIIKSGDMVAFKTINDIKNDIIYGQIYVLGIDLNGDEMVLIKYLKKSEKGEDYIKLVSYNKHHEDKDIHLSNITAIGHVKMYIRIPN